MTQSIIDSAMLRTLPRVSLPTPSCSNNTFLDFVTKRSKDLGIRLSKAERLAVLNDIKQCDGVAMTESAWLKLVSKRSIAKAEKITMGEYVLKSHDGALGQDLLRKTTFLGISFFALTGAHLAGDHGMHVVGSTVVGVVTALGGGTINALLVGGVVAWVRTPSMLFATVTSSLVGFYVWPVCEQFFEEKNPNSVNFKISPAPAPTPTPIPRICSPDAFRYGLETIALSALAVTAGQTGIVNNLHPLISASLGITIAFGGVLRDLLIGRAVSLGDVRDGCQSYGIASLCGAGAYVAMRELHVWQCQFNIHRLIQGGFPIGARIAIGFGTVGAVRALAWNGRLDGLLGGMGGTNY